MNTVIVCFIFVICISSMDVGFCDDGNVKKRKSSKEFSLDTKTNLTENSSFGVRLRLFYPSKGRCENKTVVQGISVCEDRLSSPCSVVSVIVSNGCEDLGTLEFERYWSKRCREVLLIHYVPNTDNVRNCKKEKSIVGNITYVKLLVSQQNCELCLYRIDHLKSKKINILKLQQKGGLSIDPYNHSIYTILSGLYINRSRLRKNFDQVLLNLTLPPVTTQRIPSTSTHSPGIESWKLWATAQYLHSYGYFSRISYPSHSNIPPKYKDAVQALVLNTTTITYSFIRSNRFNPKREKASLASMTDRSLNGVCPPGSRYSVYDNVTCVAFQMQDLTDVSQALLNPTRTPCNNITVVDDVAVCEDLLYARDRCDMISVIASFDCFDMPALLFEAYWSRRCSVTILHYTVSFQAQSRCQQILGELPPMSYRRIHAWTSQCLLCGLLSPIPAGLYTPYSQSLYPPSAFRQIDFLKLHSANTSLAGKEFDDSIQFKILSDLYLFGQRSLGNISQISLRIPVRTGTGSDAEEVQWPEAYPGDTGELWSRWAAQQRLATYSVFHSRSFDIPTNEEHRLQPQSLPAQQQQRAQRSRYITHSYVLKSKANARQ